MDTIVEFDPAVRQDQKDSGRRSDVAEIEAGRSPLDLEKANGLARAAVFGDGRLTMGEARGLLSHLKDEMDVLLVGGQSVGVWASLVDPTRERLARYMPFATSDIDYLGDLAAARRFAQRSGGRLFKPGPDVMNSNSTALVEVRISGRIVVVDFLHAIIGVPSVEARRRAQAVAIGGILVPVLHPLHVLRSRIANMLSAATGRRDVISTNQAKAAVEIVRLWCETLLERGDFRSPSRTISDVCAYVDRDPFGRRALEELSIDVLSVAESFLHDERLPPVWREKSLYPSVARVRARRDSRTARLAESSRL